MIGPLGVMPNGGHPGQPTLNEDVKAPAGLTSAGAFVCLPDASEAVGDLAGVFPLPSRPAGRRTSAEKPFSVSYSVDRIEAGPPSPPRGVPQLDTLGISRHYPESVEDSVKASLAKRDRKDWTNRVGGETQEWREEKARGLEQTALDKRREAKRLGATKEELKPVGKWHRDRARGMRYRPDNANACGEGEKAFRVTCQNCGVTGDHPLTCGNVLWCVPCRNKTQQKRRATVWNGMQLVKWLAKKAGLLRENRKGGAYSDKMITLTLPHFKEHEVADRVAFVNRAWPHFLKSMNAWLRDIEADELTTWYGSFEWTEGSDGKGNPHVQLWYFGPFFDGDDMREMWRNALEKAHFGAPVQERGRTKYRYEGELITEIKQATDVRGGVFELIKYIVKDVVADGDFVHPKLYGKLLQALHGRRVRRGTRGFIGLCETPNPCACGRTDCRTGQIVNRPKPADADDEERRAIESEKPPHWQTDGLEGGFP